MSLDDIRNKLIDDNKPTPCKKHCYYTRKAARLAIIKHWKDNRKIGSIYHCDSCDAFHLTSQKPGNRGFRFL